MNSSGIENSKGIIFIDFYLENCAGCTTLDKNIDILKDKYPKVEFHKILSFNDGQMDPLAKKLNVVSAPTVVIYNYGHLIYQASAPSLESMDEQLERLTKGDVK
jgi:thioredoxin-like negative regulator of GroEL